MNKLRIAFTLALMLLVVNVIPASAYTALTIGSPTAGSLSGTGDTKYFEVSVSSGQHLTVVLDAETNIYNYSLYIKFGSIPTTSDYEDKGDSSYANQSVEISNTQSGTYYLMVVATSGGGNFTITAHNASTFPTLTSGAVTSGFLQNSYDIKYYQVNVSAGEHLIVVLDAEDNLYTYSLFIKFGSLPTTSVYDDKGDTPDADQAVEITSTQAGTYYIMVRSASGGGIYTITPYNAGNFPTLTSGAASAGVLQNSYDIKYYQVTVSAGEHLMVVMDAEDNLYTYSLYIKFGSLPTTSVYDDKGDYPNADQAVEITNTLTGTYYIMVRSDSGGGIYTITPYNAGNFPTLTSGSASAGALQNSYDIKYYQVTVSAGEHLIVVMDAEDNLYTYSLYIKFGSLPTTSAYDDKGDYPNADQAVEITNAQAGTYYIMARSASGGGNYTITAYNSGNFPTLTKGVGTAGALQNSYDIKYYQVSASAGEHLFAILDAVDNLYNYTLYIKYGSLPTTAVYDDKGDSSNADQAVEISNTQAGMYYVMVRSASGGGNYTITAHNAATFPTLTFGEGTVGALQGTYDIKYYQIPASAGEHLFALLDAENNIYSYDLYIKYGVLPTRSIYDDQGDLPDADQAVEIASAQAGMYYVMIRSASGGGNYVAIAHNTSTFPTLTMGVGSTGVLQGTYDVKFYQVSASSGEHLFAILDGEDNLYSNEFYIKAGSLPTTLIYDKKGESTNTDQAVEIASAQAGMYYVMIRSTSGGGNYTITAHNNDTFPTLSLGTGTAGILQGTYDIKYYQVSIPAGEHLFVLLDADDNYNSYDFYIRYGSLPTTQTYDKKGGSPNADQAMEIASTKGGMYYVMIRSVGGGGNYTAAAHTPATFPAAIPGTPTSGSMQGTYDIKYYQITVPAGEHLYAILNSDDDYYAYDLYIKYGSLPTTTDYEDKGDQFSADQVVEVANTKDGKYYVMIRSTSGGGDYTLTIHPPWNNTYVPIILN